MADTIRHHTGCPEYYVRSWAALIMGVFLGFVTIFVLFEDVLMNGAKLTTDHLMTCGAIGIVILAGHMWLTQLQSWHIFTGLGLIVVFFVSAAYLVVASGGRNAEVHMAKRNAAIAATGERTERLAKISEAEYILAPCPAGTPKKDIGEKCGLRQAEISECASGKGVKCVGKAYSRATYEAAIEGHRKALKELPQLEENGALKSTARVMTAWHGLEGPDAETYEARTVARLELLIPYVKALLVEVGTVVFLAVGIGHRHTTVTQPSATVAAPKVEPPAPKVVPRSEPEQLTLQLLQRGERPQAEIVQLFGGDKSKASRTLARLEQDGLVTRQGMGRAKVVALAR